MPSKVTLEPIIRDQVRYLKNSSKLRRTLDPLVSRERKFNDSDSSLRMTGIGRNTSYGLSDLLKENKTNKLRNSANFGSYCYI